MKALVAAVTTGLVLVAVPAIAQNVPSHEMGGADFVKPVQCAETRFVKITGRFGEPVGSRPGFSTEGMDVFYRNGVTLVAYTVDPVAAQEQPGDRVQVCFLGRIEGTGQCHPATDGRGRIYRVYDYRQHAAYTAMNSQHLCGGA